jgi:hypothetical protein
MKTDIDILIESLEILSEDIQSGDGVANAVISEASWRLREITDALHYALQHGQIKFDSDPECYWRMAKGVSKNTTVEQFLSTIEKIKK